MIEICSENFNVWVGNMKKGEIKWFPTCKVSMKILENMK